VGTGLAAVERRVAGRLGAVGVVTAWADELLCGLGIRGAVTVLTTGTTDAVDPVGVATWGTVGVLGTLGVVTAGTRGVVTAGTLGVVTEGTLGVVTAGTLGVVTAGTLGVVTAGTLGVVTAGTLGVVTAGTLGVLGTVGMLTAGTLGVDTAGTLGVVTPGTAATAEKDATPAPTPTSASAAPTASRPRPGDLLPFEEPPAGIGRCALRGNRLGVVPALGIGLSGAPQPRRWLAPADSGCWCARPYPKGGMLKTPIFSNRCAAAPEGGVAPEEGDGFGGSHGDTRAARAAAL
jgi:hypothetical protein